MFILYNLYLKLYYIFICIIIYINYLDILFFILFIYSLLTSQTHGYYRCRWIIPNKNKNK